MNFEEFRTRIDLEHFIWKIEFRSDQRFLFKTKEQHILRCSELTFLIQGLQNLKTICSTRIQSDKKPQLTIYNIYS